MSRQYRAAGHGLLRPGGATAPDTAEVLGGNGGASPVRSADGASDARLLWVDRIVFAAGAVCAGNALYLFAATALDAAQPFSGRAASGWSGVTYLLLGVTLVLAQRRVPVPGVPPAWRARLQVGAPAALGALGLVFWLAAAARASAEWMMPGGTAFVFGTLAGGLLVRERWPWVSLGVTMVWLGLIFVIIVWYVYQVASVLGSGIQASFTPATLLPFLALVVGMLFLHVERGKLQVIALDTPAGQAVRRAMLPALVVPIAVGYVFLEGEVGGLYDSTVMTALAMSTLILAFGLIIAGTARSLTRLDAKRHEAEKDLAASRRTLTAAQRIGHVGSWQWDPASDRATWSDELYRIFGLDPGEPAANYAKAMTMIHPEDQAKFAADVQAALAGPAPYYSEYRIVRSDGQVRHLVSQGEVTRDGAGKATWMVGAVHDLTDRKLGELQVLQSREELAAQAADLARSNAELEQFAYVASHDLQEPLRMVASYVQLIERRYKGKLDEDADDFIQYAVEGSNRMQALIQDLLAFSRVDTRGKEFVPTDLGEELDIARQNLEVAIEESGAVITNGPLPRARADPSQVGQLLQNLLANAIKFRGPEAPRIHVSGQSNGRWCEITVKDNGIGIDPQYFDRIFLIFQRLHGREDYPGTGIGLAVCRRIVERHGGKIWVESAPGEGSAFHFTIPSAPAGGGG
ncbi:MAG TPA: ATP-binding protein [Candidatus Thermoplasmatota archaeon]